MKNEKILPRAVKNLLFLFLLLPFWALINISTVYAQSITNPNLSLEEMVFDSDVIVVGKVVSKTAEWINEHMIGTTYEIAVQDEVYVHPESTFISNGKIILTMAGGTVRYQTVRVGHVPEFQQGDELVLFLDQESHNAISPLVGTYQGFFIIEPDNHQKILSDYRGITMTRFWSHQEESHPGGITKTEFLQLLKDNLEAIKKNPANDWRNRENPHDGSGVGKSPQSVIPGSLLPSTNPLSPDGSPLRSPLIDSLEEGPEPEEVFFIEEPFFEKVYDREIPPDPFSSRYLFFADPPDAPVSWNIPPMYYGTPSWGLNYEYALSDWNRYAAGTFMVLANSENTVGKNGRFDFAFLTPENYNNIYGFTMSASTLGVCVSWTSPWPWSNKIIEADVILNANQSWTVDMEAAYNTSNLYHFRSVAGHEIGHAFGLAHPWDGTPTPTRNTIMNYFPQNALHALRFRPYMDDASAMREAFTSTSINDLGVYMYHSLSGQGNVFWSTFSSTAYSGGSFTISNMAVENLGTQTRTPQIGFYLSSKRNTWSGATYYYLGSKTLSSLAINQFVKYSGSISVPSSVPPGEYYIVADAGSDGNNTNRYSWTHETITIMEAPSLMLTPVSYPFGSVWVDNCSDEVTFVLTNNGSQTVSGHVILYNGTHYSITSGGGNYTLGAGQSKNIKVEFCPQSTGNFFDYLDVHLDGSGLHTYSFLSGTGVTPPSLSISPANQHFGSIYEGNCSAHYPFTLSNNGGAAAIGYTELWIGTNFFVSSGGGSFNLGPGDSKTIHVQYCPLSTGSHNDWLDAHESQTGQLVWSYLTGTGVEHPGISISPVNHAFGDVYVGYCSENVTFTLQNDGSSTQTGEVVLYYGQHYEFVSGGGAYSLAPGQTKNIVVKYCPFSVGSHVEFIDVFIDGLGFFTYSTAWGQGVLPPVISISPTSNNFGEVYVGNCSESFPFIIENTGGSPAEGDAFVWSGINFTGVSGVGDFYLLPGETKIVEVQFCPVSPGSKWDYLDVWETNTGVLKYANLTGTGLAAPAEMTISPTTHHFGNVYLGECSDPFAFEIENIGGTTAIGYAEIWNEINFSFVEGGGNYTLDPGQTKTIVVQFCPVQEGPINDWLDIHETETGQFIYSVLAGNGIPSTVLDLTFGAGFNWFSANLVPGSYNVNDYLDGLEPCNNDLIMGQNNFATYNLGIDLWIGSLNQMYPHEMYKLSICSGQNLSIMGQPAEIIPIGLINGYNWLGYLPQGCLATGTALANLAPAPLENDRLISQTGFSVYNATLNIWMGSITQMCPGEGYVLKMSHNANLNYPDSKSQFVEPIREIAHSPIGVFPVEYQEFNMMLLAHLERPDGKISQNPADVVYAYAGNQARGMASPMAQADGAIFMSIAANQESGETISFKAWFEDMKELVDVEQTLVFSSFKEAGTLQKPYLLTTEKTLTTGISEGPGVTTIGEPFPNPFGLYTSIPYFLDMPSNLTLIIYDNRGATVEFIRKNNLPEGEHVLKVEKGAMQPGLYFFTIQIDNEKSTTQKTGKLIVK